MDWDREKPLVTLAPFVNSPENENPEFYLKPKLKPKEDEDEKEITKRGHCYGKRWVLMTFIRILNDETVRKYVWCAQLTKNINASENHLGIWRKPKSIWFFLWWNGECWTFFFCCLLENGRTPNEFHCWIGSLSVCCQSLPFLDQSDNIALKGNNFNEHGIPKVGNSLSIYMNTSFCMNKYFYSTLDYHRSDQWVQSNHICKMRTFTNSTMNNNNFRSFYWNAKCFDIRYSNQTSECSIAFE